MAGVVDESHCRGLGLNAEGFQRVEKFRAGEIVILRYLKAMRAQGRSDGRRVGHGIIQLGEVPVVVLADNESEACLRDSVKAAGDQA
jgi:hypothetical protein